MSLALHFCVRCRTPIDAGTLHPICPACQGNEPVAVARPARAEASGGRPLLLALLAGLVAACGWAAVSYLAEVEAEYSAWAVGALVGIVARLAGAHGVRAVNCCGILAVLAIGGGKVLSNYAMAEKELSAALETLTSPEAHAQMRHAINQLEVQMANDPQMAGMRSMVAPMFNELRSGMDYEAWRDQTRSTVRSAFYEQYDWMEQLEESVDKTDILYAVLGVATTLLLVGTSRGRRG